MLRNSRTSRSESSGSTVRPSRSPFVIRLAILCVTGLGAGLFFTSGMNTLERFFLDARFLLISSFDERESDRIVLLLMDRESEGRLGAPQGSKWRQFHPQVVETLNQAGALVVAFDAEFSAREPESDPRMVEAFTRAGNVIAGELVAGGTNEDLESALAAIGSLNVHPIGNIPRWVEIQSRSTNRRAFSAVVAEMYNLRKNGGEDRVVTPDAEGFWIDFDTPITSYPAFSYADVYFAEEGRLADAGRTPLSVFAGRIVLIGADMPGLGDRYSYPHTLGRMHPGVYGQAAATDTLLDGEAIRDVPWALDALYLAGFVALGFAALQIRRRVLRAVCYALLPPLLFGVAASLLGASEIWLNFGSIAAAWCAMLAAHLLYRRFWLSRRLKRAMGFDPALLTEFRKATAVAGSYVRKPACILCSDIRGYTQFTSDTSPETAAEVMGEYVRAMEHVVSANGGYINKYVGDEIVAVFGFPLADAEREVRAARAAVQMLEELGDLLKGWDARGLEHFEKIGIGLDAGEVTFTEVGGRTKTQFDVMGNCINGASRLQTLTKQLDPDLLLSEEVLLALGEDKIRNSFVFVSACYIRGQGDRNVFGYSRPPGE